MPPHFKSPIVSSNNRPFVDMTYLKEAKALTVKEIELLSDTPHLGWKTIY